MTKLLHLLVPGLLLIAFAACGSDDSGDTDGEQANGDDTGAPADVPDTDDGSDDEAQPASGTGSGTLTVDGVTFEFDVLQCGFNTNETGRDNVPFALVGRGHTPDGDPFGVDALEAELGEDMDSQTISLWIGDSMPPERTYQSTRMQMGDVTTGTGETAAAESGLDWPLFELDGSRVSAEVGFTVSEGAGADDLEVVGIGVFEATCG